MNKERDVTVDPQPGDKVYPCGEKPPRVITIRFTDVTGQEYIHYTETHVISVVAWKRWCKRNRAYSMLH